MSVHPRQCLMLPRQCREWKICSLWTVIPIVTMAQFLIRGQIGNSWSKCFSLPLYVLDAYCFQFKAIFWLWRCGLRLYNWPWIWISVICPNEIWNNILQLKSLQRPLRPGSGYKKIRISTITNLSTLYFFMFLRPPFAFLHPTEIFCLAKKL